MISVGARLEGKAAGDMVVASVTNSIIEKRRKKEGHRMDEVDSFGVRLSSHAVIVVVNPSSLVEDDVFADYIRRLTTDAIEEAEKVNI